MRCTFNPTEGLLVARIDRRRSPASVTMILLPANAIFHLRSQVVLPTRPVPSRAPVAWYAERVVAASNARSAAAAYAASWFLSPP